jgi:hypothetical protein
VIGRTIFIATAILAAACILFLPFRGKEDALPSVTLDWTAPGDDRDVGTATSYTMKFSSIKPDTASVATMNSWWSAAGGTVRNMPEPLIAGTKQRVTVTFAFVGGQTYYFVMKACDEKGNCSAYSNVASKSLSLAEARGPARRVIDLLIRSARSPR